MHAIKVIAVGAAVLILLAIIIGAVTGEKDAGDLPSMEKITASCDEQFGSGTQASADCQLAIVAKAAQSDREGRMRAAEAGAR